VVSHGGIWDALHIFRGQDLDATDEGDFGWVNDAAPRLYEKLKTGFNETGKTSKCWTVNGYHGGKEILMSPLAVHGNVIGGIKCKSNSSGLNRVLETFREHQIKSGIIGSVFDDWVDAYRLSSPSTGAPFPISDGIHYPPVFYRALVHELMHKILVLNSPPTTAAAAEP
jgi:hypothetical protein